MTISKVLRSLGAVPVVLATALSQGCISARPWRSCAPPCAGKQLRQAEAVLVYTHDQAHVMLRQPRAAEDDQGPYLVGPATVDGQPVGPLKVYTADACAIFTRRVEPGRLAANLVLVPLAVAGEALVLMLDPDADPFWVSPVEPLPQGCAPAEPGGPGPPS